MSRTTQRYLSVIIAIVVTQSTSVQRSFADTPDKPACGAMVLKSLTEWQEKYPFLRSACHLTPFPSTQSVGKTKPSTDPAQQIRDGLSISEMGQTLTFPSSIQSIELRAVNGISLHLDHAALSGSWHVPGDGDQLRTQLSLLHEKKIQTETIMHGQGDDEQFDIPLASKLNLTPDVLTDGPIAVKAMFPEGIYFFDYSPASTLSGERDVRKDLLMSRLESRRINASIKQGLMNAGLDDNEASAVIQSVRETLASLSDKDLCDLVLKADKDALSTTTSTFDAARLGMLFAIQNTPYSVDGKSYRLDTPGGQTIYVIQIISQRFELTAFSQKGECVWKGMFDANASPDSDLVMSRLSKILGWGE